MGSVPIEAAFTDWACILGELLYFLVNFKYGEVKYINVPLNLRLITSINAHSTLSLYRGANERITPVARFAMLHCLEQGVSVAALSRCIGVSENTVRRLRHRRQQASNVQGREEVTALFEKLAFESGKTCRARSDLRSG